MHSVENGRLGPGIAQEKSRSLALFLAPNLTIGRERKPCLGWRGDW